MFLPAEQVQAMGFASVGNDVKIDANVMVMGAEHIHIGDHTRIDAQVILSAGPGAIRLGRNVHIAAAAHLWGAGGITLGDYAGISSRCSVYSASDDYTEGYLSNPTVPDDLRLVSLAPVVLEDLALLGTGTVVLPGVTIGTGAAVGALSLVNRSVPEYALVAGRPLRTVGRRSAELMHDLVRRHQSGPAGTQSTSPPPRPRLADQRGAAGSGDRGNAS